MATKKSESPVMEQKASIIEISDKHLVMLYRATVSMVERDAKNLAKLEAKLAKLASPLEAEYEKLESRIANLAHRVLTHNSVLSEVKRTLVTTKQHEDSTNNETPN